ncbi:tail assembly protein, partial [Escherichia coli EC1869]
IPLCATSDRTAL